MTSSDLDIAYTIHSIVLGVLLALYLSGFKWPNDSDDSD